MAIQRFSSREGRLDKTFLIPILKGAKRYLRIAGYFRSSIFELVEEEIQDIDEVKIVCNSDIDLMDFALKENRDAALRAQWQDSDIAIESSIKGDRYALLDKLLNSGKVEIRVVPKGDLFLHGKAGCVEYHNEKRSSFIGSANETKSAFTYNHEIIWQDDSPISADWVEDEFNFLWGKAQPIPESILEFIHHVAHREEIPISEIETLDPVTQVPKAAMIESPLYCSGDELKPWQKSFVSKFMSHRNIYKKARLLLADEVGVGKTLSMAVSALLTSLLNDGPALILAPKTLTLQWQAELLDKLGISSAVWSSNHKGWMDENENILTPKGRAANVKLCPRKIGIISTGLITNQVGNKTNKNQEVDYLLDVDFGIVILDEAHKARKSNKNKNNNGYNNLLNFMHEIAKKTTHIILGTATPIQTDIEELWELFKILATGADFVIGDPFSRWLKPEEAKDIVTNKIQIRNPKDAWDWINNPISGDCNIDCVRSLRNALEISDSTYSYLHKYSDLNTEQKDAVEDWLHETLYLNNPFVNHTVLRKRKQLEDCGLLQRIDVDIHPNEKDSEEYQQIDGLALKTSKPFEVAHEAIHEFCHLVGKRTRTCGFLKSMMKQRLCSSFASGKATAQRMIDKKFKFDEDVIEGGQALLENLTSEEESQLKIVIKELSKEENKDPKLDAVLWFLNKKDDDGKSWRDHGCIIFSQYYKSVEWIAQNISRQFPNESIAVYAGANKSRIYRNGEFTKINREAIKKSVKKREISIIIATDAACEGLNLQTLGTLINIDLPWNPARLEQRLGRIKRFGQARKKVDMLNLVYQNTNDEEIYNVLSQRMKDNFDFFGSLPDTIITEWIDEEKNLNEAMENHLSECKRRTNSFDVKYSNDTGQNSEKQWKESTKVLSRQDIHSVMTEGWDDQ